MQRSDYSHTLCKKDFHIAVKRRYQAAGTLTRQAYTGKQAPENRYPSLLRDNFSR
ncbi:hypothetical protein [Chitinophaga sp.]|uniref:hypothetical protein n=1 Tax=Chitinophaga sp. TaxID=1869181 RepID=UPI0031D8AFDD